MSDLYSNGNGGEVCLFSVYQAAVRVRSVMIFPRGSRGEDLSISSAHIAALLWLTEL